MPWMRIRDELHEYNERGITGFTGIFRKVTDGRIKPTDQQLIIHQGRRTERPQPQLHKDP